MSYLQEKDEECVKTYDSLEKEIITVKQFRKELDGILQRMKDLKSNMCLGDANRQLSISITDLESSIMRLGMTLKEIGTDNPYPNSYNPDNTVVDPTADGLKL